MYVCVIAPYPRDWLQIALLKDSLKIFWRSQQMRGPRFPSKRRGEIVQPLVNQDLPLPIISDQRVYHLTPTRFKPKSRIARDNAAFSPFIFMHCHILSYSILSSHIVFNADSSVQAQGVTVVLIVPPRMRTYRGCY